MLVVDDSATVRKILVDTLAEEHDIEVVGTAPDPYIARDKVLALRPDVLTLDIEMPRMDGLTFLGKLMQFHPLPVVVISSLAQSSCNIAVEALRIGAMEVLAKPSGPNSVGELRSQLAAKIRTAARGSVSARPALSQPPSTAKGAPVAPIRPSSFPPSAIIALGASTGGVSALQEVLLHLPADMPPIVITQHIPAVFSRAFAERLNQICQVRVKEAQDGEPISRGHVAVAPGDKHLLLQKTSAGYCVAVKDGPQVCFQRPSVDVLFQSVARAAGANAVGVILTGMGADGAEGLAAMKRAGAYTIAQNEASCVVFGMPREAINRGAVDEVQPLTKIAASIQAALNRPRARAI